MVSFSFSEILYEAIRENDLPLAEIVVEVKRYGYTINKGTLSRWASGATEPSRKSLPILRLLPDILRMSVQRRMAFNLEIKRLFGGLLDSNEPSPSRRKFTLGPLAYFTGRQKELRQLSSVLRKHRSISISGLGGIGKTTLARQLLSETEDQFVMGCDALQLHPTQTLPEVITLVARQLRLSFPFDSVGPGQIEAALEAISRESYGMDLFFLLDNVENESQVGRLLKAAPSITWLTTSRRRLDFGDGLSFPLKLPTPAAATRMLLHYAELPPARQNKELAKQIVTRLGYLPIAIRIAAGLLRVASFSGLSDLLHWLETEGIYALQHDDEDKNIITFFAKLIDRQPEPIQQLFIMCGAFAKREISRSLFEAVATKLDLPYKDLRVLALLSIIYWRPNEKSFELHPLVYEYALSRFQAAERQDEIRRAKSEVYVDFAVVNHGQQAVLSKELDDLWASVDYAEQAEDWNLLHRLRLPLADNLWVSGNRSRLRELDERCLVVCRGHGDQETEAIILRELSYLLLETGDYAEAEPFMLAAQERCDRLGLVVDGACLRRYRAMMLMRQNQLAVAEEVLAEAYTMLEPFTMEPARPGNAVDRNYAMLLNCHAALATRQGNYEQAWEMICRGRVMVQQAGSKENEAGMVQESGDIAYLRGQIEQAYELWLEAEALGCQPDALNRRNPNTQLRLALYEGLHGDHSKALRLAHAARRGFIRDSQTGAFVYVEALIDKLKAGGDLTQFIIEMLHNT